MRKKQPTHRWHDGCLHIETGLGIVNIRPGLTGLKGHHVDSVEIIPDPNVKIVLPNSEETKPINIRLIMEVK